MDFLGHLEAAEQTVKATSSFGAVQGVKREFI